MDSIRKNIFKEIFDKYQFPDWYLESPSFIKSVLCISSTSGTDSSFMFEIDGFLLGIIRDRKEIEEYTIKEVEFYRAIAVLKGRGYTNSQISELKEAP